MFWTRHLVAQPWQELCAAMLLDCVIPAIVAAGAVIVP